jgi:imidazolonepropionase-like amidohydrolase
MLAGDDYGVAYMPHGAYVDELIYYVQTAGFAALDVIRWATRNGAELLGLGDQVGTIAAGKLADLLVVDGDPSRDVAVLKDRARLLAIMKDGVLHKDELGRGRAGEKPIPAAA